MSEELRPCFCGKIPHAKPDWCDGPLFYIECECGRYICTNNDCTREELIALWNARPEEDALAAKVKELEAEIEKLRAAKNDLIKGRNVIVIEILGETILQSELDDLAETWVHFGMPRGKYELHPKEIEQLTNYIRAVISGFDKAGGE